MCMCRDENVEIYSTGGSGFILLTSGKKWAVNVTFGLRCVRNILQHATVPATNVTSGRSLIAGQYMQIIPAGSNIV